MYTTLYTFLWIFISLKLSEMYRNPQFHYWRPTKINPDLYLSRKRSRVHLNHHQCTHTCVFLLLYYRSCSCCVAINVTIITIHMHIAVDVSYKKLTNYYHIYTCTYVRKRLHRYTDIHTYIYIYIYLYIYIYIYIYIHILRNIRV